MKAIQTVYRGVPFRSRLEAQWAEFFDTLGLAWEYEPEGYVNGERRYLPGFWLPSVYHRGGNPGVFFEVKPSSPLAGEIDKALMLAYGSRKPVLVVESSPRAGESESLHEYVRNGEQDWDDYGLCFSACDACMRVSVNFGFNETPCPCGKDLFSTTASKLCVARNAFPYFSRWNPRTAA